MMAKWYNIINKSERGNGRMENILSERIMECRRKLVELEGKRERLPYHGREETDYYVYLEAKALDGAIRAIQDEKRENELLLMKMLEPEDNSKDAWWRVLTDGSNTEA